MSRELIALLKNGDRNTLRKIYSGYRKEFQGFARQYGMPESESEDIYQDAIIVTYEKARSGKLETLECSLKTYLFSVGKYMILNQRRQDQRKVNAMKDYNYEEDDYVLMEDVGRKEQLSEYQKILLENFDKLGSACRQILDLFYRKGQTIDEIMAIMGYENKNVVKSQKSRCLKTLKDYVKDHG